MEITSQELREKISKGNKLVIDFYATWCGPCKIMKPMFETVSKKLKDDNSDVELYTFNIENDRELAAELELRSVPTIKGFANGTEVFTEVGLKQTNAIIELANRLK
jgi:thioredoxin 1